MFQEIITHVIVSFASDPVLCLLCLVSDLCRRTVIKTLRSDTVAARLEGAG